MSKTVLRHSRVLDEIHKVREEITNELRGKSAKEAALFWSQEAKSTPSAAKEKSKSR